MRPWVRRAVPVVLTLAGLVLLAVPWLPGARTPRPAPWPQVLAAGADEVEATLRLLEALDQACSRGDLAVVQRLTTRDYLGSLLEKLRMLGHRADGLGLRAISAGVDAGLAAELRHRESLGGRCGGTRAVLFWRLEEAAADAGYAVRRGLKVVVLQWDGAAFQVAQVLERPLLPDQDRGAAMDELWRSWQDG